MKTRVILFTLILTGFALGLSIEWTSIDGGGGTSSGGNYSVRGTIGQPDAGAMSGGTYTLEGGFWSPPEPFQTPGGPPLTIDLVSPDSSLISWPAASPGWQLEKSINLQTWTPVTLPVVVQGGRNTVTAPAAPAREFYRLRGP